MMKPDEMIAVIQAHKDGKKLEARSLIETGATWHYLSNPSFCFDIMEYRVKPEPKELFAVFTSTGLSGAWLHAQNADLYAARCNPDSKARVVRMQEVL